MNETRTTERAAEMHVIYSAVMEKLIGGDINLGEALDIACMCVASILMDANGGSKDASITDVEQHVLPVLKHMMTLVVPDSYHTPNVTH